MSPFTRAVLAGLLAVASACGGGEPRDTGAHVVLVTLDGVRWQEFFGPRDPLVAGPGVDGPGLDKARVMERFWRDVAPRGVVYGAPGSGSLMVAPHASLLSLPGYMTLLGGVMSPCTDNRCGRITGWRPLGEHLALSLDLPPEQVATVASWGPLALAAESVPGVTTVHAGPASSRGMAQHVDDHDHDLPGPRTASARRDRETVAEALAYLRDVKPRYLHVGLNDSDEDGHDGDYAAYVATLGFYADVLAELVQTLDGMGEQGRRTTLLVTTDHGRGVGPAWTGHGGDQAAATAWLFAMGPGVPARGVLREPGYHSHLDVRPTVLALMGLCVDTPGAVLRRVLPPGTRVERCPAR